MKEIIFFFFSMATHKKNLKITQFSQQLKVSVPDLLYFSKIRNLTFVQNMLLSTSLNDYIITVHGTASDCLHGVLIENRVRVVSARYQ